jgi:hypothetical protein
MSRRRKPAKRVVFTPKRSRAVTENQKTKHRQREFPSRADEVSRQAETAYRRGFHQALALAVDLLVDLGSVSAVRMLIDARDIASELRRSRKTYFLMDEVKERVTQLHRQRTEHAKC